MTNIPTLWQNTCAGLSEFGQEIYLRGAGRDEQRALFMASDWDDHIAPTLQRIACDYYDGCKTATEIYHFIRERHFRRYFPDGRAA